MTDKTVARIGERTMTTAQAGQVILFNNMPEVMKGADLMASAKGMVPAHLLGNPGGCMAIIMQAQRWGLDPFSVAQKTHLVQGTLGYEAQLVNAVLKSSRSIAGRFHYEYRGDGNSLECRVGAIPAGETEIVWGEWLCMKDVATKNSPLWKTNPKQQLGYLQVKNWARAYCPEAILGFYTADELEERPPERDITPAQQETQPTGSRTQSVRDRLLEDEEEAEVVEENDTGESNGSGLTYAQVAEALNKAKDQEALSAVANGLVPEFLEQGDNDQYRDELMGLYKSRKAEFQAADTEAE